MLIMSQKVIPWMVKNILEVSLTFFDSNDMYSFSIHVFVDHRNKEVKYFNYVNFLFTENFFICVFTMYMNLHNCYDLVTCSYKAWTIK